MSLDVYVYYLTRHINKYIKHFRHVVQKNMFLFRPIQISYVLVSLFSDTVCRLKRKHGMLRFIPQCKI